MSERDENEERTEAALAAIHIASLTAQLEAVKKETWLKAAQEAAEASRGNHEYYGGPDACEGTCGPMHALSEAFKAIAATAGKA